MSKLSKDACILFAEIESKLRTIEPKFEYKFLKGKLPK